MSRIPPLEEKWGRSVLSGLMRLGGWSFGQTELREDLERFKKAMEHTREMDAHSLFSHFAEVRTLAYYRWRVGSGRFWQRMLGKVFQLCFPPQMNLYLWTDSIGPGFVPFHAFSTVVAAKEVGRNVTVFQGVTIGHTGPGRNPRIGDCVTIFAGACVIGDITIGDHAVIGAGSVVVDDVPPEVVVAGNPARVVRKAAG